MDDALFALLSLLKKRGYYFVAPTPATHARVVARAGRQKARCVEDVLGWSLPFEAGSVDGDTERLLNEANALVARDGMLRSLVRVSSQGDDLYLHSAFPTDQRDAVFFGPDSYRFADLITAELAAHPPGQGKLVVDVGTGAGVGGIVADKNCDLAQLYMTEINPVALRFARINAAACGIEPRLLLTNRLDGIEQPIDLAVANPPYIMDERQRLYRDGGGQYGGEATTVMADFILPRLAKTGKLILYSGSAILSGKDEMKARLEALAERYGCRLHYRELDPDVFGEELERPAYADVDRIAVISAIFERR